MPTTSISFSLQDFPFEEHYGLVTDHLRILNEAQTLSEGGSDEKLLTEKKTVEDEDEDEEWSSCEEEEEGDGMQLDSI